MPLSDEHRSPEEAAYRRGFDSGVEYRKERERLDLVECREALRDLLASLASDSVPTRLAAIERAKACLKVTP